MKQPGSKFNALGDMGAGCKKFDSWICCSRGRALAQKSGCIITRSRCACDGEIVVVVPNNENVEPIVTTK